MANRYWRGGSGTWDATNTANWSATSGGAGGASAPTSVDDVFFDTLSSLVGYTITVGTNAVCNSITVSAPASGVAAFSLAATSILSIYGSMLLNTASSTWTGTSGAKIQFRSTTAGKTITTNGINLISNATNNQLVFDGVGGEWTLGSAITTATPLLANGSLITNNFNITCSVNFLAANTTSIKALTLGSSTIVVAGSFQILNTTNFTLNAGTSVINMTNPNGGFNVGSAGGAPATFYELLWSSVGVGTVAITGSNIFNKLTFASLASTGLRSIRLDANQTVSGTLTLGTANTAIRRMFAFSDIIGTPRTITANTIATLADVDFRDIVAAGASGTWAGTRLGNCLGNSNITFDAGKPVYWNLAAGGDIAGTGWALTSGGAVNVNNFPLAQDTAIYENTGLNSGATVSVTSGNFNIPAISFATRTLPVTWQLSSATSMNGDITLSSAVTLTGTGFISFVKQGVQTITSAGKTWTQNITLNNGTGSFKLADAFTATLGINLTTGTLDLNNFDLTAATFTSSNTNTRAIAFGTGKIVVTGISGLVWSSGTATGFSYTGSGVVELNSTLGVGIRTIAHGGIAGGTENNALSFNVVAGTDTVNLALDANKTHIKNLNFTGFSGTTTNLYQNFYGDLTLSTGMTNTTSSTLTMNLLGTGTQVFTMNGKTIDCPIAKSGAGTLQLLDNLTQGTTRAFTFTAGGIDLNGNDLTVGTFSTTGATARNINHGAGGDIHVLGATWTASGSNLTTEGTGSISMDSASAKTFAGGGFTYQTLNQGGAGDLNITGANRFKDMTNTVQPCAVVFPANVTTSVEDFSLNGTPGNVVSIRSSVAGQRFGLDKVAA